jgi:hypothetical protein
MITLKDIFKAVCEHIITNTNIPLADADMEEPVIRPSFKIFMDTAKTGLYSSALRQVRVYFNIYFYASDRKHSKSEIFEIEDKLAFSFLEPFFIKETCCVYIDDVDFEKVTDGIFNCSFDFEIGTEFIDESDFENMEELYIEEEI